MFALLTDYVDVEKGLDIFVWTETEERTNTHDEIVALYEWWNGFRPLRKRVLDEIQTIEKPEEFKEFEDDILDTLSFSEKYPEHPYTKKINEIHKKSWKEEEDYKAEDTEMLIRLIKIRGVLWT